MRRGPAAAPPVRRRPAAGAALRMVAPAVRWSRGDEVLSTEFTPGLFGRGAWVKATKASYFEKACDFAGKVERVVLEGAEVELIVSLTGTTSEELLRYATGVDPPLVRVHLGCDQKRASQALLHLQAFRQILEGAPVTWEENLKVRDEKRDLHRRPAEWGERADQEKETQREGSDSRERERKQKKKRKKGREDCLQPRAGGHSPEGGSRASLESVNVISGSGDPTRGAAGPQSPRQPLGKREFQGEDEGQRQRVPGRKQKDLLKVGETTLLEEERNELLRGGGRVGMLMKEEKGVNTSEGLLPGQTETGQYDVRNDQIEDVGRGLKPQLAQTRQAPVLQALDGKGERRLPAEMFHSNPAEAATSGWVPFCTGTSQIGAGEEDGSGHLGIGRGVAEKGAEDSPKGTGNVGELFAWLEGVLDNCLDRHCKTEPLGRTFPLPTSLNVLSQAFPHVSPGDLKTLKVLAASLNSLNGEGVWNDQYPTPFQLKVLEELRVDCTRINEWKESLPQVTWVDFFKHRGIDYKGEEILTAQYMEWENVRPALPAEVGGVNLEEVVELGSAHYVRNFEEYLLPENDQPYTKPPRVMVAPDKWEIFCRELLDRGIFSKVHEDDLHRVSGLPVLNGLFGVSKGEFEGNYEVMRIIMNLIPVNRICRGIDGDIATLPS